MLWVLTLVRAMFAPSTHSVIISDKISLVSYRSWLFLISICKRGWQEQAFSKSLMAKVIKFHTEPLTVGCKMYLSKLNHMWVGILNFWPVLYTISCVSCLFFEGHKVNSFVGLMGKRSQEEPGEFTSGLWTRDSDGALKLTSSLLPLQSPTSGAQYRRTTSAAKVVVSSSTCFSSSHSSSVLRVSPHTFSIPCIAVNRIKWFCFHIVVT